jgi:hypothetical protein
MNLSTRRPALATLLFSIAAVTNPQIALAALGVPIYWVEAGVGMGRLGVVDLDGSNFQVLLTGLSNPQGVDIDPVNGHVYFTEAAAGKIRRINLDGSNPVDILTGLGGPSGLSLDLNNSKIYWTNLTNSSTNPTVQRSNLNGTNVQTLITGPNGAAIEVDPIGNKIYWSEGTNTNTTFIRKANLDGSSPQTIFTGPTSTGGTAEMLGLTVGYDSTFYPQGRLYFSLQQITPSYTLESMDLNGGPTTTIVTNPDYQIVGTDFYDGYKQVLWTNYFGNAFNSGEIWRAMPDGSAPQMISTVGFNRSVADIAIWPFPPIPEPSAAAYLTIAGVSLVLRRRQRRIS